jgi:PAS domain S-box-containing protein
VRQDKEQKLFSSIVWILLLGTLTFFALRLSSGAVSLPLPIWYMLLFLDGGAVVFLFMPQVGRGVPGVPGRHEEAVRREEWYPQTLAEMVDGRGERVERAGGVLPPARAIPPVPLVPLVLLFAVLALAYPHTLREDRWLADETERLRTVYKKASGELLDLEGIVSDLGSRVSSAVRWDSLDALTSARQATLIGWVDSVAVSAPTGAVPFPEVGIQIFSSSGERVAWGGSPHFLGSPPRGEPGLRVFTSRTPLYTLLVGEVLAAGGGIVIVDLPLEVNYHINNRFLRSASLGEVLTRKYGQGVEFGFSMGEHGGAIGWNDPLLAGESIRIISSPAAGVQALGVVRSSSGQPLARLKVVGDPYPAVVREAQGRRSLWAGLVLCVAAAVIAVWVYRTYCKREARVGGRFWTLARRIVVLASFVVILRFLLIRLSVPGGLIGTPLFDPAFFADDFPGGFLRTAGDFLISSIFALILVFGCIKAFRTYYRGRLEQTFVTGVPVRAERIVAKAALVFGSLAGSLWLSERLASRVVILSHARIIGLDVNFFDLSVLNFQLSLLFMISSFFIVALFVSRLALVWGGAPLVEGLAASGLALAGMAVLFGGHWLALCAAAGLVAFSFRVFPLLRKEEAVSIVFASFFLVLIVSLAVFATGKEQYAEMRQSRLTGETLQHFNFPEELGIPQVLLPDLCEDISNDRTILSLVVSKRESAAFEIWAEESRIKGLNLSCVFEVFDAKGTPLSRFAVGMPFIPSRSSPDLASFSGGPRVETFRQETRRGAVYYCRGYAPVRFAQGELAGWVEITIPYFFEDPELLARTSPLTPEILHNIERVELAPRKDEPENLLVARVVGGRVLESSSPALKSGTVLSATPGTWFVLRVGRERYHCVVKLKDNGRGYLAGYRMSDAFENILQWGTIVSLDVLLMFVSLIVLLVLKRLPVLRGVMPDVSLGRGLGFRQKVLLSFLVVSILPVLIIGVFSSQVIARRLRAEAENQALLGVQAAVSLIDHSVRTEAASLAAGQYIGELLASEGKAPIRGDAGVDTRRFTLIGSDGGELYGSATAGLTKEERSELLGSLDVERVAVSFEPPVLYAGIVVPIVVKGNRGGSLYYRRALDDDFVRGVSEALGKDINVYYDGLIRASSERELFVGGFLDPICQPSVFVDIALQGSGAAVLKETLGDYSYNVASAPLRSLGGHESAVISVPQLYQSLPVREEVQRTSTLILGLLALLFASMVALGAFLAGKIFNPIEALRGGTRRIIAGELEFRLDAQAPDEIGELVASFNSMTAALREARRGLLERQRYLAAVLDNIATGVMATDREGTIITLNPAGERILRLSGVQVVGRKPEEVFGAEAGPMLGLFSQAGGEIREVELGLFSGEAARTVKAVVASLVEGGERLGTVVVFDDLTELIRSKKLAAWVEMARQIAHEVKNPLTPIKLSAQLMRKAYESGSGDFAQIFEGGVDTIIQQTEILRRIATEFSGFGKALRLNPEGIALDRFLGEVVSYYRGAEGVTVRLSCADGIVVRADREALRKILVNLLENAIEAMPGGGEILVTAERDGSRARISVVDSGTGLPPEIQDRLFEPYFSTKTNGIGIGLAISQSLARSMDGEIRLRNRDRGRGVEATVVLPLAKEE